MLKRVGLCVFFLGATACGGPLWRDIDQLNTVVRYYNEYPQPKTANPFDMRYEITGCHGRLCDFIGGFAQIFSMPWPWWSAYAFRQTLTRVCQRQQVAKTYKIPGRRYQHIVVFGGLYGSFHSLVRCLNKLRAEHLVDNTFVLRTGCAVVFLGNSIDRSAYGLETLAVILQLMDKNPGRVVLLRGKHEDRGYWRHFGTSDQVRLRLGNYPQAARLIDAFFSRLPATATVSYVDGCKRERLVLLSARSARDMDSPLDVRVATQITSDLPSLVYRETNGLRLLPSERGATTWSLLSCPSQATQIIHRFFNDSFTIIEPSQTNHWRLLHFYRDVRKRLNMAFNLDVHDLFTGQKMAAGQSLPPFIAGRLPTFGVDQCDEIVIGSTYDADGLAWDIGNLFRLGISLRIMQENIEHGGVNGKFVRLVMLNDANNPFISPQRIKQLATTFKTDVLLAPFGTVTLQANVPTIKKHAMVALFPLDGDTALRQSNNTFLLYLRPGYADEAQALAAYASKNMGFNRALIFFQDHPYGLAVRDGAYAGLKKYTKLADSDIAQVSYARSTLSLPTETIAAIKKFAPDLVFFGATRAIIQELVRKLTASFFVRVHLLAEGVATVAARQFLKQRGIDLTLSSVVPNPLDPGVQIAREYRAAAHAYMDEEPLDPITFEGYVAADLCLEALKRLKEPVSAHALVEYFQRLQAGVYKGLPLAFDPKTRQLSHTVWIDDESTAWKPVEV